MSLRPRYSLLTLLLLTVAIAVGIKLWRGPHRVVTRLPFSQAEVDYFSQLFGHVEPGGDGGGGLETESIRDGWKERVLSVKSIPAEDRETFPLYTFNIPDSTVEQGEVIAKPVIDESLLRKYPLHTNRRIQRVIATYHAHTDAPKDPLRLDAPGLLNTVYLVTESGAIYQQVRVRWFTGDYFYTEIKFETIPDPYLRARIAEDLATLKK
jgi:hypothetical protein